MLPANLGNQLSDHVITDFAQTFERDTGLPMTSCREIIEDSYSIFHSFSYLIEHLFYFIDSAIPCQTFIIKGLTAPQRRDFYVELSGIRIHFTKNRYFDHNRRTDCTDICISTANVWSVPDYRTTPRPAIYQYGINAFNAFYSRIDNLLTPPTAANGNIIVSLENFLKFKRIFAAASYNYNRYINIVYMSNQPAVANTAPQHPHYQPCGSYNTKIKHQLADLIFDVKDNLTDAMYKEILEKIALISK